MKQRGYVRGDIWERVYVYAQLRITATSTSAFVAIYN